MITKIVIKAENSVNLKRKCRLKCITSEFILSSICYKLTKFALMSQSFLKSFLQKFGRMNFRSFTTAFFILSFDSEWILIRQQMTWHYCPWLARKLTICYLQSFEMGRMEELLYLNNPLSSLIDQMIKVAINRALISEFSPIFMRSD